MKRWDPAQRRLAKQVLGRSARILLAGWIWERRGAAFFQSEATSALGDLGETPSAVIAELQKLVAYGLSSALTQAMLLAASTQLSAEKSWALWKPLGAVVSRAESTGGVPQFSRADVLLVRTDAVEQHDRRHLSGEEEDQLQRRRDEVHAATVHPGAPRRQRTLCGRSTPRRPHTRKPAAGRRRAPERDVAKGYPRPPPGRGPPRGSSTSSSSRPSSRPSGSSTTTSYVPTSPRSVGTCSR